jgi:hypothetical protein
LEVEVSSDLVGDFEAFFSVGQKNIHISCMGSKVPFWQN